MALGAGPRVHGNLDFFYLLPACCENCSLQPAALSPFHIPYTLSLTPFFHNTLLVIRAAPQPGSFIHGNEIRWWILGEIQRG